MIKPPNDRSVERRLVGMIEWMSSGPNAAFLMARRMPSELPVTMLAARPPPGFYPHPPLSDFAVRLAVGGAGRAVLDYGGGRFDARPVPGIFTVTPPETPLQCELDTAMAHLAVCLPSTIVRQHIRDGTDGGVSDLGPLHRGCFSDRVVRHLVFRLWRATDESSQASWVFADSLVHSLIARLTWLAAKGRATPRDPPLSGSRLRIATALMADRLSDELGLEDIAAAVGLSSYYFLRSFRAATGMPPHAWRNSRRIAHAQQLMMDKRISLAAIAAACGFSSQAHFATTFRQVTGFTPSAWRAGRLK